MFDNNILIIGKTADKDYEFATALNYAHGDIN